MTDSWLFFYNILDYLKNSNPKCIETNYSDHLRHHVNSFLGFIHHRYEF